MLLQYSLKITQSMIESSGIDVALALAISVLSSRQPSPCSSFACTSRQNLQEGEAAGPVHAPFFPAPKFEEIWIFLLESTGQRIVTFDRLKGHGRVLQDRARFPSWFRSRRYPDRFLRYCTQLASHFSQSQKNSTRTPTTQAGRQNERTFRTLTKMTTFPFNLSPIRTTTPHTHRVVQARPGSDAVQQHGTYA